MSDLSTAWGVTLEQLPRTGMITLRADLADKAVSKAVKAVSGAAMPDVNAYTGGADGQVFWMSPDELLILRPYAAIADDIAALTKALANSHALVADVSDARSVFMLRGAGAREVIAKLSPIDVAPAALPSGTLRRTRFGQVAGAVWCAGEDEFGLVCFRSVGAYLHDLLQVSIDGGPVGAL